VNDAAQCMLGSLIELLTTQFINWPLQRPWRRPGFKTARYRARFKESYDMVKFLLIFVSLFHRLVSPPPPPTRLLFTQPRGAEVCRYEKMSKLRHIFHSWYATAFLLFKNYFYC
jgi:hypothetical protein